MVIGLLIVVAGVFFAVERLYPAHELPKVRGWWGRVVLVNVAQIAIVLLAGMTWDRWFQRASLLKISEQVNAFGAALITYFLSCVVFYFWHRIRHESELFWRLCHQLHHSPRRIELLTSFYKHPVEITLNSILTSGIVFAVMGCDLKAAAIYTFIIAAAEYFYHWNVRTPRWVGWFMQRPESHRVHHQRNRHTMNYADLPVIDWIFGTLNNPKAKILKCGFDPARERRVAEMLLFRDVNKAAPPTCFGCAKRWICQATKMEARSHAEG
jgi:sterol desaturase/sphingolipid hydroxylase (fatty acid hydroxylase superfamily)